MQRGLTLKKMHPLDMRKQYVENPKADSYSLGYVTDFSVGITVMQRHVFDIRHHGNHIATVSDFQVTITNAGYGSSTTRDRLNRILHDNDIPFGIVQRNRVWIVVDSNLKKIRDFDGSATFTMVAGVWTLDYFAQK